MLFQVVSRCLVGGITVVINVPVKGGILTGHSAFHLPNDSGFNAQVFGDGVGFVVSQPGQPLFRAAQIKKELALRLGGGHFDDAPVAQNKLVNLRLDPVHGKGDQPHTNFRVKALDRLHQANITFLDKVCQWQTIAGIAFGDVHNKTKVGHNQLTSRLEIVVKIEALCKVFLLLSRQHRNAGHRRYVGINIATRY